MFSALGAAPVSIPLNEAYSALQTKIADGQENPLALIESAKFYEVQKFCSLTNHAWDGFWLLASARIWKGIPQDAQQVMQKHFNAAAIKQRADIVQANADYQKTLESKGLTFNTAQAEAFQAALGEDILLQGCEGQVWRRSLDAAAKIRRQHRLIAMHLVEQTSVALPRMTGVAGALAENRTMALGSIVAAVAAALVIAEIIVLFSGVSARYLFHRADHLVGRARRHSFPVAGNARRGGCISARRAHADDGHRRHGQSAHRARSSTCLRLRRRWRFSPWYCSRLTNLPPTKPGLDTGT